jgi:hypothetical protein
MSEIKINSQGEVKLYDSDNSNYVGLKAPATVASDETFILPSADGSANFLLRTDGSGNLSFIDVAGLTEPGIDWQSTIKTGDFTAVSSEGYFINTTSGAITATLPSSPSPGDVVAFKDYAATFATNNLTIGRNSSNIQGAAVNSVLSTNRASVVLVYVDATKGWLYVQESNVENLGPQYIAASGGTVTTSGDYKIHTFNSTGTFTVSSVGNPAGSNTVDYMVVGAGAGGGASAHPGGGGGGGGAGGWRASSGTASGSYTAGPGPLTSPVSALPVSAQGYPITIGAGGSGATGAPSGGSTIATNGANSVFSSVTSAGGGMGGINSSPQQAGGPGGSGGGSSWETRTGGTGNTPPVSPPQGNTGGIGSGGPAYAGGGGGGATAVGSNANGPVAGAASAVGGAGATSCISASPVAYAGGGGGGAGATPGPGSSGGTGGGGAGAASNSPPSNGTAGTANTGGGGGSGAGGASCNSGGGGGGSGVVIIRYKYQN